MKKSLLFYLFCLWITFPPLLPAQEPLRRGLFVTVIQDPPVLSSRDGIDRLIDDAGKNHVEVLFVQIYRAGQAWFPSQIAEDAPYQISLKKVGEDPFARLIKKAHARGLRVHAWLNMLSLSENENAPFLKKYGPEILTRNTDPKNSLKSYKIDAQYFLEPGDPRVRKELIALTEEILRAYPELDGIQFDYIRYPDTKPAYGHTLINIDRFKNATGRTSVSESDPLWHKWKRDQVTEFLEQLVARCKQLRPAIEVSATGCAPYARAYYEAFQDWPAWLKLSVVDFITFMSYSTDPAQFERFIKGAREMTLDFSKVYIGVPAYKLTGSEKTFEQIYDICRNSGGGACVVFHYGSLVDDPSLAAPLLTDPR